MTAKHIEANYKTNVDVFFYPRMHACTVEADDDDLFFSIANHSLTIVEADAHYIKPFTASILLIIPRQTTNVLLKTKRQHPNASFLMAARPYDTGVGPFDKTTTAGIFQYVTPSDTSRSISNALIKPILPAINDTAYAANFSAKFWSLASLGLHLRRKNLGQRLEAKLHAAE